MPGEWQRKAVESRRIWLSLLDLEKPLICRLRGPARGMCATIASLCDVIIADETASLADTHINMGLAAADGCNAIWPYIVGFAKTKDLLFNATVLSAADALALGLVTQVVRKPSSTPPSTATSPGCSLDRRGRCNGPRWP